MAVKKENMSLIDSLFEEPTADTDELARRVIGCAIEVHRHLGPGYDESVYEKALCEELKISGIKFSQQHQIKVFYKGLEVGEGFVDLLIEDKLIIELKSVSSILPIHLAQTLSYLKALNLKLGLLINFNVAVLKEGIRRVVSSK